MSSTRRSGRGEFGWSRKTDTHQRLLRKTHNEKKHNESFEYNTNDPLTHQTDYISALYIIIYINRFMYIYIHEG